MHILWFFERRCIVNYISADSIPMNKDFIASRLYNEGRDVEYFNWLCDFINLNYKEFDILIYELHSIDFEWVLEFDSNRSYDGFVLRYQFYGDSVGDVEDPTGKACTVLEALIGLAQKMDYILDDDDRGDRTRIWFWEMISNLGLDLYSNDKFIEPYGRDLIRLNEIHRICENWMQRRFEYDGFGSPFPLKRPFEDQRKLDLIRQMNAYILENYMYQGELL